MDLPALAGVHLKGEEAFEIQGIQRVAGLDAVDLHAGARTAHLDAVESPAVLLERATRGIATF